MSALADPLEAVRGRELRMLIGGELVEASGGRRLLTHDPSTGEELIEAPDATAEDVDRAVAAAQAAQPAWEALGVDGRAEVFERFAVAIEERADELALIDAVDSGNPYKGMQFDASMSLELLRGWHSLVRWHGGRTIPSTPNGLHYTAHRPYGVVARIIPFNHPLMFAITRPLCALIAGNAVVLKPAHQTPVSALVLAEMVQEIFPPGVLNILSGGAEPGDALVTHPEVRRISFTGSVPTGLKIQERAAQSGFIKTLSLELGGKNPMLVFPDCDLDEAVQGSIEGMNFGLCQGQSCGSNSRVFVHRDIYEDFVERLGARLDAMQVGPAYAAETQMGPLVSSQHRDRVMSFVDSGKQEGARLVAGGGHPGGEAPGGGYFVAPTLFADVDQGMKIAREEIFGPVMAVAPWSDLDEVLSRANDSELGLTASVWTRDLDVAHGVAARLNSGYVWINDSSKHFFGTPFGGWGDSGLGREDSIEEYESYLQLKVVHTMLRPPKPVGKPGSA